MVLQGRLVFICLWLFVGGIAQGAVKSTNGNVLFSSNVNNSTMMTLNTAGLGIGVTPSTNLSVTGNAIFSTTLYVGGAASVGMEQGLYVNGTQGFSQLTLAGNGSAANSTLIFADSSAGNLHVDLPEAAFVTGHLCMIKKTSPSNTVWVSGAGPIDGYTNLGLTQASSGLPYVTLIASANVWNIISVNGVGETISSTNLVLWLPFETQSGNVLKDYSGQNQVCSMGNGLNSSDLTTGAMGQGLKFNRLTAGGSAGLDNIVIINRSASLDMSGQITVSIWYRHGTANGQWNMIFCRGDYWLNEVFTIGYQDGSNTIGDAISQTGQPRVGCSYVKDIEDGKFHLLTLTYDSRYIKNYVDGVLGTTVDCTTPRALKTHATWDFWIGLREGSPASNHWPISLNGRVDDARIYNRALSAAEIALLYQAGR